MKRWIGSILTGVVALSLLGGCGNQAQESNGTAQGQDALLDGQELILYTWEGMFPDEVISGFETETGCEVIYQNFTYDEEMLEKLTQTEGGEYDLIFADDYIIEQAIDAGLVQTLDQSQIPNIKHENPIFKGQFFDKNNEYTVNYGAGIPLLVYDPNAIDFEITGYQDLWNEELNDSIALIANNRVITGMVLLSMGESMNTEDIAKIEEAGKKLQSLAPNVRLIKDDNTQTALLTGEASVAYLYTSQVYEALNNNPELKVVVPEEGVGFGLMSGFIPSQAPNSEAAHAFLNYIMEPETFAKCTEFTGYYCTNKDAEAFIAEENKDLLVIPEDLKGEMIENIGTEANDVHQKVWTEFKAATGTTE